MSGRLPVLLELIGPIANQAAIGDEVAVGVDCGQLVPGRQCGDQLAMTDRFRARQHDHAGV